VNTAFPMLLLLVLMLVLVLVREFEELPPTLCDFML